ncbi:hypothetical protein IAU60_002973 [Kwoniella sp. DSM 27419]
MFALRRIGTASRPVRTLLVPSGAAIFREYHGDPGPSSTSHRTQQRRSLRQATIGNGRAAVSANRQVLDSILDAPATRTIGQKPSFSPSAKTLQRPLRLADRRKADKVETPYTTSTRLRRMMAKHPDNPSVAALDAMVALVTETRASLVNAPVWNILLGYMGRVKKFDRMWKLYNDMKKRGIKPTSRTYSTMINAYSGISHGSDLLDSEIRPIEERTLSRVTILFEQSQVYLRNQLARAAAAGGPALDLGVASSQGESLREEGERVETIQKTDEIDIAPINAYLKFLGRHGLLEEMQKAFVSMDTEGPLAPDTVTYTTMFASLYHLHIARAWQQQGKTGEKVIAAPAIGLVARGIWDQCIRSFAKIDGDPSRRIDNELFLQALRCFLRGRPEDQRFALELVQHVWSLPSPGQATLAGATSRPPVHLRHLPTLSPNLHAATALLQLLTSISKPHLATHYTTLFLSNPAMQRSFDQRFLKTAILAYSECGDVAGILSVLDGYQPMSGLAGWDLQTWRAAVQGARWAGDYDAAMALFRRATHLPHGIDGYEPGLTVDAQPYKWAPPNGKAKDVRGVTWVKTKAVHVDAQMMSSLIKVAMQGSNANMKAALNAYHHLGGAQTFLSLNGELLSEITPEETDVSGKLLRNKIKYDVGLAHTLNRAIEKLGPTARPYQGIKEEAEKVVRVWGRLVEVSPGSGRAKSTGRPTDPSAGRGEIGVSGGRASEAAEPPVRRERALGDESEQPRRGDDRTLHDRRHHDRPQKSRPHGGDYQRPAFRQRDGRSSRQAPAEDVRGQRSLRSYSEGSEGKRSYGGRANGNRPVGRSAPVDGHGHARKSFGLGR